MDIPGPPTYQEVNGKPRQFSTAFKPFEIGAERFPAISKAANKVCKLDYGYYLSTRMTKTCSVRWLQ